MLEPVRLATASQTLRSAADHQTPAWTWSAAALSRQPTRRRCPRTGRSCARSTWPPACAPGSPCRATSTLFWTPPQPPRPTSRCPPSHCKILLCKVVIILFCCVGMPAGAIVPFRGCLRFHNQPRTPSWSAGREVSCRVSRMVPPSACRAGHPAAAGEEGGPVPEEHDGLISASTLRRAPSSRPTPTWPPARSASRPTSPPGCPSPSASRPGNVMVRTAQLSCPASLPSLVLLHKTRSRSGGMCVRTREGRRSSRRGMAGNVHDIAPLSL